VNGFLNTFSIFACFSDLHPTRRNIPRTMNVRDPITRKIYAGRMYFIMDPKITAIPSTTRNAVKTPNRSLAGL